MPFAIELLLDPIATAAIRNIWTELKHLDIPLVEGASPHITLAVCDHLTVEAFGSSLRDFASSERSIPVTFASVGVFPGNTSVVFLAPVTTAELLTTHERFHRRFASLLDNAYRHYLPGYWVPHCTLGGQCPNNVLPAIIEVVRRIPLPIEAKLESIGVVEVAPIVEHYTFALASSTA